MYPAASVRVLSLPIVGRVWLRVAVCLGLALLVAGGVVYPFLMGGRYANDFQWPYAAAVQLRRGINPYYDLGGMIPVDFFTGTDPLFYPLPAVLVALPFSYLPAELAGTVFSGLSAFLLAWALTHDGRYWRLVAFTSAPAIIAFGNVQWSPLVYASIYLWWLSPVIVCKPSIGAAAFAARPRWFALTVGLLVAVVSLVVLPTWPIDWLRNLQDTHHPIPLLWGAPGLLLLSLLAWRRPAGRLFAVWSFVPQVVFFYDALVLWFVAKSWQQMALLSGLSWVALILWSDSGGVMSKYERPLEYVYVCLPALGILLWNQRQSLRKRCNLPFRRLSLLLRGR
jgi:hypothetical protein